MSPAQPVPRIPLVVSPSEAQAAVLKRATLKSGHTPNAFLAMAHSIDLAARINAVGGYFLRFGALPERTVKLAILRTAHRTDSLYEFAQHRKMSLDAGVLNEDEVVGTTTEGFAWGSADALYIATVD